MVLPFSIYLESQGSDETLYPRSSETLLGLAFLQGQRALDDILPHIILFGKVEQLADLRRSLRSQSTRYGVVGQSGDLL